MSWVPREKGILFSGEMVRAILAGKKTQTRRVVTSEWFRTAKLPYRVGDVLWVRETFRQVHPCQVADGRFYIPGQAGIPGPPMVKYRVVYRADGDVEEAHFVDGFPYRCVGGSNPEYGSAMWTPSVHMPKWAARIWLEVVDVRIQRVQDITDADAMAEGVDPYECPSGPANPWPQQAFLEMWQRLYGKNESLSVRANPWVAAYTFKRIERPESVDQ